MGAGCGSHCAMCGSEHASSMCNCPAENQLVPGAMETVGLSKAEDLLAQRSGAREGEDSPDTSSWTYCCGVARTQPLVPQDGVPGPVRSRHDLDVDGAIGTPTAVGSKVAFKEQERSQSVQEEEETKKKTPLFAEKEDVLEVETEQDQDVSQLAPLAGTPYAAQEMFLLESEQEGSPSTTKVDTCRTAVASVSANKCAPVNSSVNGAFSVADSEAVGSVMITSSGKKVKKSTRILKAMTRQETRRRISQTVTSSNINRPVDYAWLEGTLDKLARNEGASLGCKDTSTGKVFFPIFVLAGSCPNTWCGMQAVLYCVSSDNDVDFWWVKPEKSGGGKSTSIEKNTLSRQAKGPHKNDPGRSKSFLKPLADLFQNGQKLADGTRFGIERTGSESTGKAMRAFIEHQSEKSHMVLIWQEDWGNNPFTGRSYIKGKMMYQKDLNPSEFHSRPYAIVNNDLKVSVHEDPPWEGVIPGDHIKELLM